MRPILVSFLIAALLLLTGCLEAPSESAATHDPADDQEVLDVLAAHVEAVDAVDPDLPGAEEELVLLQEELEEQLDELLGDEGLDALLPPSGELEPATDRHLELEGEPAPMDGGTHCFWAWNYATNTTSIAGQNWTFAQQHASATGGNYFAERAEERASWAYFWADLGRDYAALALGGDTGAGTWAAVYMDLAQSYAEQVWIFTFWSPSGFSSDLRPVIMKGADITAEQAGHASWWSLACAE